MKICLKCQRSFETESWQCPECGFSPRQKNDIYALYGHQTGGKDGFSARFFGELAVSETNNFWFQVRNDIILYFLKEYFFDAVNILEIGCGNGFVLSGMSKVLPNARISGSDIFLEGIENAKLRIPHARFYLLDACRVPFYKEFDLIGLFDVLEHIKQDTIALHQVHGALKEGGGLIVTVPQHKALWSRVDVESGHKRRYSNKALIKKLESCGFDILRSSSFMSFLLPLMAGARTMAAICGCEEVSNQGLAPPEFFNALMKKIFEIEILLMRKGIDLPVGGSRIVAAVKRRERWKQ